MSRDEMTALARSYVAKWAPRLHVQDWLPSVTILPAGEKIDGDDDIVGQLRIETWHRVASIVVREDCAAQYRESHISWPDETDESILERVVLHELDHITEYPEKDDFKIELKRVFGSDGVVGDSARTLFKNYCEMRINTKVRTLIEADRGLWVGQQREASDG